MAHLKLFLIGASLVFLQPVRFRCSASEDIQILIANGIPILFEEIPILLLCSANTSYHTLTWLKDGEIIAECAGEESRGINLPTNVWSQHSFQTGNTLFCSLNFTSLSIVHHRGLYSCVGRIGNSSTRTGRYLEIFKRRPVCESGQEGPQEYLVQNVVTLNCHNPYYSPARDIRLYVGGSATDVQQRQERDYTFAVVGIFSTVPSLNGTTINCTAVLAIDDDPEDMEDNEDDDDDDDDDVTGVMPDSSEYSCSIGPIYVYEFSFLKIEEIRERPSPGSGITVNVSCRVVPVAHDAVLTWYMPPELTEYTTISNSGLYSVLVIESINHIESKVFNLTCYGSFQNQNLSETHSLNLMLGTDEHDGSTSLSYDSIVPLIMTCSVVGAFILLSFNVFIFTVIYKYSRRRGRKRRQNDNCQKRSLAKDTATDIQGIDERYQAEPGRNVSSKETDYYDAHNGENYDLPPFGQHGGTSHVVELEEYQTVAESYDEVFNNTDAYDDCVSSQNVEKAIRVDGQHVNTVYYNNRQQAFTR